MIPADQITIVDDTQENNAEDAPSTPSPTPAPEPTPTPEPTQVPTPTTKPETGKDDAAAPTARELELFKKLHGGSFDPMSSMDKRKLQQLRQAAQQTGEEDVNKLAPTAYALQDKDKSTARASQKSAAKQPAMNKATAAASFLVGLLIM